MVTWYIHGAGASERSFVWLQNQLPQHEARHFSYSIQEPVASVIDRLETCIKAETTPVSLIGHSLGGIVAYACANLTPVERIVTLCAPFGGVMHTEFLAWFSMEPLIHDLRRDSPVLRNVRAIKLGKPHLAIVGNRGLPFMSSENDGAVTVASQTALPNALYTMFALNHFEVLLSDEVIRVITDFLSVGGY